MDKSHLWNQMTLFVENLPLLSTNFGTQKCWATSMYVSSIRMRWSALSRWAKQTTLESWLSHSNFFRQMKVKTLFVVLIKGIFECNKIFFHHLLQYWGMKTETLQIRFFVPYLLLRYVPRGKCIQCGSKSIRISRNPKSYKSSTRKNLLRGRWRRYYPPPPYTHTF